MNKYFYFWEKMEWYDVRVLNEREVRAGAGILFALALPIFLVSCINMDFYATKIFITLFMIDFFVRVCINPKFAPSLIVARFFVGNQKPEYVWAPQKRFAWGIGLGLSVIMFIMMWLLNLFTPLNMLLCVLCLILLFFESAFWICIGCNLYNTFSKKKAELCPGWVCEVRQKEEIQKISFWQVLIVFVFLWVWIWVVMSGVFASGQPSSFCATGCPLTWGSDQEVSSWVLQNPCPHKNIFNP